MRWIWIGILAIPLAGCALPPAVTVASLVLDAGSYMTTGKSVADHGLSAVTQRDCRLLGVLEGEVCAERPAFAPAAAAGLQPATALGPGGSALQLAYRADGLGADPLAADYAAVGPLPASTGAAAGG